MMSLQNYQVQRISVEKHMSKDSVERMIEDWKEYKLSEFAFSVTLGKSLSEYTTNPIHVKAAKMLVEQGIEVVQGDIIKYILTKDGVKPLRLASFKDIDGNKYIEHLKTVVAPILEPMGIDFDELVSGEKQLSLEQFFGKSSDKEEVGS